MAFSSVIAGKSQYRPTQNHRRAPVVFARYQQQLQEKFEPRYLDEISVSEAPAISIPRQPLPLALQQGLLRRNAAEVVSQYQMASVVSSEADYAISNLPRSRGSHGYLTNDQTASTTVLRSLPLSSIAQFRYDTRVGRRGKKKSLSTSTVSSVDIDSHYAVAAIPTSRSFTDIHTNVLPHETSAAQSEPQTPQKLHSLDSTPTQRDFKTQSSLFEEELSAAGGYLSPKDPRYHQHNEIMSRIEDAFDVREWDPPPQHTSPDNDPELVPFEPQPLTYTTVGSVVKSNSPQVFTPPNRIQRESSRRLAMAPTMPRLMDTTPPRMIQSGPQQGPQPHVPSSQSPYATSQPLMARLQRQVVSEDLRDDARMVTSRQLNTNQAYLHQDQNIYDGPPQISIHPQSLELPRPRRFDVLGLENMQTINRLSQFTNPVQQAARDRISQLTAKSKTQNSYGPQENYYSQAQSSMHQSETQGVNNVMLPSHVSANPNCPPPRFNLPQSTYSHTGNAMPPQPLTAGPPGQRQAYSAPTRHLATDYRVLADRNETSRASSTSWAPVPRIPTAPSYKTPSTLSIDSTFSTAPTVTNEHCDTIVDTLSWEQVKKYFPNGPPSNFGRCIKPLHPRLQQDNEEGEDTTDENLEERNKRIEDWWHSGFGRTLLSAEDHITNLDRRCFAESNGYPWIPLPTLARPDTSTALKVEYIRQLTDAECAEPLLNTAFGSLLSYVEKGSSKTNHAALSKFVEAPTWCVDHTPDGYRSFFGEDQGPLPKRIGRDVRYRPVQGEAASWGSAQEGSMASRDSSYH